MNFGLSTVFSSSTTGRETFLVTKNGIVSMLTGEIIKQSYFDSDTEFFEMNVHYNCK